MAGSSRSASVEQSRANTHTHPSHTLSHTCVLTSSGYLTPSRLCSEPSVEALQHPQWKVMRPTLNFDLRAPPLT